MQFTVLPVQTLPTATARDEAFLITDNWDDWFQYSTMYSLMYVDNAGTRHSIGSVKIGQIDMPNGQRRPDLPETFEELDERFFSLGQDDSYYANLNQLDDEVRDAILIGLRDMARDERIFEIAIREPVTGVSL